MKEIVVEFWGDYACFSAPYAKVERMSYPAPTPLAAIGMLQAVYNKPAEFIWQVNKIEILTPIQYISFKRNELKSKIDPKAKTVIDAEEDHTPRQTIALKDVRYRITAEIIPRKSFKGTAEQLYAQAIRRIEGGKCFYQPCMGCREFVAFFELSDGTREPAPINMDMGLVVHDMWDLDKHKPTLKCETNRKLFNCVIEQGVIKIPPRGKYDSSIISM